MVTHETNYIGQLYFGLSTDDPADVPEWHNGDRILLMDQDQMYIYDEAAVTFHEIPMGGGGGGGGATLYYNIYSHAYAKSMVIPIYKRDTGLNSFYYSCDNLENVRMYEESGATGSYGAPQNTFENCSALKNAYIESLPKYGHYFFKNCRALEEVQLGSIGHPVSVLTTLTFVGCTQVGLTITVYVADDAELPLASTPWGATNATIIYRSSTSGEVIPV